MKGWRLALRVWCRGRQSAFSIVALAHPQPPPACGRGSETCRSAARWVFGRSVDDQKLLFSLDNLLPNCGHSIELKASLDGVVALCSYSSSRFDCMARSRSTLSSMAVQLLSQVTRTELNRAPFSSCKGGSHWPIVNMACFNPNSRKRIMTASLRLLAKNGLVSTSGLIRPQTCQIWSRGYILSKYRIVSRYSGDLASNSSEFGLKKM